MKRLATYIVILVLAISSLSHTCFAQQTVKSVDKDRDIYILNDFTTYNFGFLDLLVTKDCYENPDSSIRIIFNIYLDSLGRVTKSTLLGNTCRNCNMDKVLLVCEKLKSDVIHAWFPRYYQKYKYDIISLEHTSFIQAYIDPKTRKNTLFSPIENTGRKIKKRKIIKDESNLEKAVMAIIDNTIGLNNAPVDQYFVFKTDSKGRIRDIYTRGDLTSSGEIKTRIDKEDLSRLCRKMRDGLRLDFIADIVGKRTYRYAYYTFTFRP